MGKTPHRAEKSLRGRPTKYDEHVKDMACKLAAMFGATDEQIAKILHVAGSTLALWKAQHDDFSEALKAAKETFDSSEVKRSLLQGAKGFYFQVETFHPKTGEIVRLWKYQPGSLGAQVFWLANRQKDHWRSIKGGVPELPEVPPDPEMTDAERSVMQRLANAFLEDTHKTRLSLSTGGRS